MVKNFNKNKILRSLMVNCRSYDHVTNEHNDFIKKVNFIKKKKLF